VEISPKTNIRLITITSVSDEV
jgi:hypothetical protein